MAIRQCLSVHYSLYLLLEVLYIYESVICSFHLLVSFSIIQGLQ
nr:MAG TPA: hypothetical protein [Caudoviricetes sp.]